MDNSTGAVQGTHVPIQQLKQVSVSVFGISILPDSDRHRAERRIYDGKLADPLKAELESRLTI